MFRFILIIIASLLPMLGNTQEVKSEGSTDIFAAVKGDDKFVFIDKQGNAVIPFKYDDVGWYFSEGLISVGLNNKYGCIDKQGKV